MSKILMVDYYGACDRQGKAVGHSPKVAKEYRTLFSEKDKIDLAVSPCIAAEVEDAGFGRIYRLPYNIVEADYDKISKRILDKVRILQNIHRVRQIRGYDLVWYYRVDFFLMLYMLFSGKRKGRGGKRRYFPSWHLQPAGPEYQRPGGGRKDGEGASGSVRGLPGKNYA